jgi:hypothetical protein
MGRILRPRSSRKGAFADGPAFSRVPDISMDVEAGNSHFVLEPSNTALTWHFGKESHVTIPGSIDGLWPSCFFSCRSVQSIAFEAESQSTPIAAAAFAEAPTGPRTILIHRKFLDTTNHRRIGRIPKVNLATVNVLRLGEGFRLMHRRRLDGTNHLQTRAIVTGSLPMATALNLALELGLVCQRRTA